MSVKMVISKAYGLGSLPKQQDRFAKGLTLYVSPHQLAEAMNANLGFDSVAMEPEFTDGEWSVDEQ